MIKPARTLIDKVGSIATALVFNVAWVNMAVAGLVWAGVLPQHAHPHVDYLSKDFLVKAFFSDVWAPIWEESLFRYSVIELAKLAGEKAILPAILISSTVFAFGHGGSSYALLIQGVLGCTFSWVYLRVGYWGSVVTHASYNIFLDFFP